MSELGKRRREREYDDALDADDEGSHLRELNDQGDHIIEQDDDDNNDTHNNHHDDRDDDNDNTAGKDFYYSECEEDGTDSSTYVDEEEDDEEDENEDDDDEEEDEDDDSEVSSCALEDQYNNDFYRKHEVDEGYNLNNNDNKLVSDNGRDNPLVRAFSRMESDDYCLYLMEMYPKALQLMDQDQNYPLHHACYYRFGDVVIVKLVELFPEAVRRKNVNGHYPLHIACSRDCSVRIIEKLIEIFPEAVGKISRLSEREGLLVNEYDATLVYQPTKEARECVLGPQSGRSKGYVSCYPIHIAILCGQSIRVMEAIIREDPLALKRVDKEEERTPLHLACSAMEEESVALLLLQYHHIPINAKNRSGKTPLHMACSRGSTAVIERLLAHPDINVNATTRFGASALHYIVKYASDEDIVFRVEALLRHPYIIIDLKDVDNKTPLDILIDSKSNVTTNDDHDDVIYVAIQTLFEEFLVKRRWDAFQRLLDTVEIW